MAAEKPEEKSETCGCGHESAKQTVGPDKVFELLRAELTYEANLIANRTSWFVASQAFFFTSLAAALDHSPGVPFRLQRSLLFPMIPWVSLIVCGVILVSVLAAIDSANKTRARIITESAGTSLAAQFIPRSRLVVFSGLLPSVLLPVVFAACWIWILRG